MDFRFTIALIYDFDGTLSPGNMQEYDFIPAVGKSNKEFWTEANTLADEYFRDLDKGLPIQLPYHYFPDDDPAKKPIRTWRSHGYLFYSNWLNYYVYQTTPYDLARAGEEH